MLFTLIAILFTYVDHQSLAKATLLLELTVEFIVTWKLQNNESSDVLFKSFKIIL